MGNGAFAGGPLQLTGGVSGSGATGAGGAVTIAGGASAATNDVGGAVTATYHGPSVRGYFQYADASSGEMLVARPLATYTITTGVTGLANPPGVGMWTVAGS